VALLGAGALAAIALSRGEPVNGLFFVVAGGGTYLVAYRFYSAFIAARVLALDATRATPAERLDDGRDFVPTNRWVVPATTSRRSPARGRSSVPRSPRSSATCRGRCGW